jgi:hypothetical protein
MPTQQRVRLHQEERPPFTTEHTRECGEERSVVGFEPRMWVLAVQHRELMAQHEHLDILGTIAPRAQHQQVEYQADKKVETRHAPILAASELVLLGLAKPQVTTPGRVFGPHSLATDNHSLRTGRSGTQPSFRHPQDPARPGGDASRRGGQRQRG